MCNWNFTLSIGNERFEPQGTDIIVQHVYLKTYRLTSVWALVHIINHNYYVSIGCHFFSHHPYISYSVIASCIVIALKVILSYLNKLIGNLRGCHCYSITGINYKVGMAVIKSTKTRVVVMVTNTKRHPYIYFLIVTAWLHKVDVGMSTLTFTQRVLYGQPSPSQHFLSLTTAFNQEVQ